MVVWRQVGDGERVASDACGPNGVLIEVDGGTGGGTILELSA